MDTELRTAERRYKTDRTRDNRSRLNRARRRAGWTKQYVPCNGCNPNTRTVRHGSSVVLCPKCCGNGWTHMEWVPPEGVNEDLGFEPIDSVPSPPAG